MKTVLGVQVETNDREIVFTRTFAAPRQTVWDAWTRKEHLLVWWGPHQFTNSDCSVNLQVGGTFLITMHGPDGNSYPCKFIYEEIVPIEKMVWYEPVDPDVNPEYWGDFGPPPSSRITLLFEDQGSTTKMTIISTFETNEGRDKILAMGAAEGWAQSLERLEALVKR